VIGSTEAPSAGFRPTLRAYRTRSG
jgi:hypothetical protein